MKTSGCNIVRISVYMYVTVVTEEKIVLGKCGLRPVSVIEILTPFKSETVRIFKTTFG